MGDTESPNKTFRLILETNITIDAEGPPATNANLPPYYALCYIIKIETSSATGGGGGGVGIGSPLK